MANAVEQVSATLRDGKFNKNAARRVRVSGLIPAVVYGGGQPAQAITVDPKIMQRILHSETGHNTLFNLVIAGGASGRAMIVDWQNEPVKGTLLHLDLKRIAMDKLVTVSVPVQLSGVPVGVKMEDGVLDHVLREVEIECLPDAIPNHLDVDVTGLHVNDAIHIKDLPQTNGVKYLGQEDAVVAHVSLVKEEPLPDATLPPAGAEPEVEKKGKGDSDSK